MERTAGWKKKKKKTLEAAHQGSRARALGSDYGGRPKFSLTCAWVNARTCLKGLLWVLKSSQ